MHKVLTKDVQMIEPTDLNASELVRLYGNGLKQNESYTIAGYCRVEAIKNSDGTVRIPEYIGVMFVNENENEVITSVAVATGIFFEPTGNGKETEKKQIKGSCITSTDVLVSMFGKRVRVKDFTEVRVLRYQSDIETQKRLPVFEVIDDEPKESEQDEKKV